MRSRPELWAEVSSEEALGRRLAQFGEIRITRVEPETTVAWEGERASGTVELAPAGWGTKVTLTAVPAGRPAAIDPAPEATATPEPEAITVVRQPEPKPSARAVEPTRGPVTAQVRPEPGAVRPKAKPSAAHPKAKPSAAHPKAKPSAARPETKPGAVPPPPPRAAGPVTPPATPARKLGFFARLFRRRPSAPKRPAAQAPRATPARVETLVEAPAPTPPPAAPRPSPPALGPEPPPPDPGPAPTLPKPASAPADLDTKRTVAILTEVLDDLGSDHHRPLWRDALT